jgi:NitT/TauT family transport system ATP-binding protein
MSESDEAPIANRPSRSVSPDHRSLITDQLSSVAVQIESASKTYPSGLAALRTVDLQVRDGEFVTLLGPSGCGKSTLLRMVGGLLRPSAGTVRVWPDSSQVNSRERLAFVFQSPTLMPWASVERNVRLPLDLTRTGADAVPKIQSALGLVGLDDFRNAYPRELSGGMQMRVSIARALVTEPRLLLMDEPFGALDEITRYRLDREIRDLWARRALTVLFVTHSIYEAVFLSTRVLVMSARPGRIIGEIDVDEPHPRTDAFRVSERFTRQCAQLSAMLADASAERHENGRDAA